MATGQQLLVFSGWLFFFLVSCFTMDAWFSIYSSDPFKKLVYSSTQLLLPYVWQGLSKLGPGQGVGGGSQAQQGETLTAPSSLLSPPCSGHTPPPLLPAPSSREAGQELTAGTLGVTAGNGSASLVSGDPHCWPRVPVCAQHPTGSSTRHGPTVLREPGMLLPAREIVFSLGCRACLEVGGPHAHSW